MEILIPFAGGLGMFIYGMQIMAQGLENAAGNRMKSLLEILTKNKFFGVLLGAAITAVIQSSSATTVMVVGFVNASIMNLEQAMGVIMGANIGTTITGWLVSAVEWAEYLSPATLAPIAIMAGVVIMMTGKRYVTKETSKVILGFGLLFVGITTMSTAVEPLKENEAFRNLFVVLGSNPILGIAAGAIVTAIIQSSSASVGILQSLAFAGLVPYSAAVYIIMGQNIGTCITALLSGLGANRNAKTAGLMHLLFNIIGTVIFSVGAIVYLSIAKPVWAEGPITQTQISMIHTLFNVGTTVLLFPMSGYIIRLAKKLGRVENEQEDESRLRLDKRVLNPPGLALETLWNETLRMGTVVEEGLTLAQKVLMDPDAQDIETIREKETVVDKLTGAISDYAIRLSTMEISPWEHQKVDRILGVVADLERISDQSENIAEQAETIGNSKKCFSQEAKRELQELAEVCVSSYRYALKAISTGDTDALQRTVELETQADELVIGFRASNVRRMTRQQCYVQEGVVYQDALVSLERISDHARNVAEEIERPHPGIH